VVCLGLQQRDRVVRFPSLSEPGGVGLALKLTSAAAVPAWFTCHGVAAEDWRLWFPTVELFVFRPLPTVVTPAVSETARLLLSPPVSSVGMHIRHGDLRRLSYRKYVE
jgi:hypothetical protein